ncbi:MAG: hypothetical protein Alpg2KO_06740 [Alphaproteobacteria bacterium]
MKSIVIAPHAERQLQRISEFTEHRWGPRQAALYTTKLLDGVFDIAANPILEDRDCSHLSDHLDASSLKYRLVGRHFIIYRKSTDAVEVLAFVSPRQNLSDENQFSEHVTMSGQTEDPAD